MSITSPALTVERVTGSTGARIGGVDLNALDDETFATIRQALLERGVVHLPGQDETPEAHNAFGELHTHPPAAGVDGHPEIMLLEDHGSVTHAVARVPRGPRQHAGHHLPAQLERR